MLILSRNYDGRKGTGREATFDGYGDTFAISLTGYDWTGTVPDDDNGQLGEYRLMCRYYHYTPEPETMADYHGLHAPLPIKLDWLAEKAEAAGRGNFATVAAMLAAELAERGDRAIGGWAALAMNGG